MTAPPRKSFSFATMMVLAQRRHAAQLAAREAVEAAEHAASSRAEAARRTLSRMMNTKRLVAVMISPA